MCWGRVREGEGGEGRRTDPLSIKKFDKSNTVSVAYAMHITITRLTVLTLLGRGPAIIDLNCCTKQFPYVGLRGLVLVGACGHIY